MSQIIRKIIKSAKAPAAIGPYSQAVQVNNTLYISGCLGMDPQSGNLVPGGTQAEARQAMNNMNAILEEAGISFNNVVKCTILLADINDFASINSIYQEYFKSNFPARATYQGDFTYFKLKYSRF
jgi:2-iminobutanoate/2-iminopropanoate deaminase